MIPRPSGDPFPHASYSLLSRSQHVEHCSLAKFRDLGIPVQWSPTWATLRLWRFVRAVQDTSWLSFHGILRTADRLTRFGIHIDPACFCVQPADLLHLFTSCPFAVRSQIGSCNDCNSSGCL